MHSYQHLTNQFFFRFTFFLNFKKLKTLKIALKLGLISNNSPTIMKNDIYY